MFNVWFTADLHLGHANVIKFCQRPFSDVDEMNDTLISNWNSLVKPGDRVYLLGDVSFSKPDVTKKLLSRLKGQIYLVRGNHDKDHIDACAERFVWIKDYYELKFDKQKIVMSHYPFLTWNGCHYGTWHLHGHCHGSLPSEVNLKSRRMDVGVDCHFYKPIAYEQVKEIMGEKEFCPADGHQPR